MIPGLAPAVEARLAAVLDARVSETGAGLLSGRPFTTLVAPGEEARALGVEASGARVTLIVTDRTRRLGHIRIEAGGRDNLVFFDNHAWGGQCHANLRLPEHEQAVVFNDIGDAYVALRTVFLRSPRQFVFWGRGASAVGLSIELQGEGEGVVIGDDALIADGVWIRNYDMHAMIDLATGAQLNRPPVTTVLERHVWLGQDALLLSAERIGTGAIIGARSLVKGRVPPRVVVAGTPARVLREGVSWGRSGYRISEAERRAVGLAPAPPGNG